jgi:C4-dicarboxylate-specific signal transduction histidine kinase
VETAQLKQAKAEMEKLTNQLEERVAERTRELIRLNEELRAEIEERRRVRAALQQSQLELAHVARLTTMGELVASIAHEVGQPLTAIVTKGNFLLRRLGVASTNREDLRSAAEAIVAEGKRASSIISQIPGLLKKQHTVMSEIEINDVIQEVVSLLSDQSSRYRILMSTELATRLPRVRGDGVQLQQVMVNLIINAVDATRGISDGPREILIRSGEEAGCVVVSVEDTVMGFTPEQMDRIFEPFFTTKAQGIGMGLSISRSIIENHSGELRASRRTPRGAKVEFVLPTVGGGSAASAS